MSDSSPSFGFLRSLLNEHTARDHAGWTERLLTHLQRAYIDDAALYEAQWLPYLQSHLPAHDVEFEAKSLNHLARLAALLPHNAQIMLRGAFDGEDDATYFAHAPHTDRVTHLRVGGGDYFRGKGLLALFDSPLATNLKKLSMGRMRADAITAKALALLPPLEHFHLERVKLSPRTLDTLVASGCVNALDSLSLDSNEIKGKDVPGLLESEMFAGITRLRMKNTLNDKGLVEFAESPAIASLVSLDVHEENLKHKSISALFASPHTSALRDLTLYSYKKVGPKIADAIAARDSGLERLTLSHLQLDEKGYIKIAASKVLAACTHLGIHERDVSAKTLRALATSPALTRLRSLELAGVPLDTSEQVEALLTSPTFTDLHTLELLHAGVNPTSAQTLATHLGALPKLHTLRIHYGKTLGDAGAAALAASDSLHTLDTLSLQREDIGDEGAIALANSPHLSNLRELDLESNSCARDGAMAIARSSSLIRLDRFLANVIPGEARDPAVAAELIASGKTRGLERLSTRWLPVEDAMFIELVDTPEMAGAFILDAYNAAIGAAGMRALCESPHMAGIHTLNLNGVQIDQDAAQALADTPHLAHVSTLNLKDTGLTDEALATLLSSPHLTNLRELGIQDNAIGRAGIEAIAGCAALRTLSNLGLDGEQVPQDLRPLLAESPNLPESLRRRWIYDW